VENVNQLRMMWFDAPHRRLATWRDFRKRMSTESTLDIVNNVVTWWGTAPVGPRSIDPYDVKTWPTAWELLDEGNYCRYSIGLGMAYTIFYCNENIKNNILRLRDLENQDIYMAVLIDDKFLLNYEYGEVVDWQSVKEKFTVQQSWNCDDVVKSTKYHE